MLIDRTHTDVCRRSRPALSSGALALLLAAAVPALLPASRAPAATEMEQALALLAEQSKPTDPELLARGIEQYNQGKYEDAQITLQQVKVDGLPQPDRARMADTLRKVEGALNERMAARAAFDKGEEAMAAKDYAEAVKQYRAASENKFADDATRTKATSQLAVAQAAAKPGAFDKNAYFKEAIAEYKAADAAGDKARLASARAKFAKLDEMGFKGGLLDTRPAEYIRRIDTRLAALSGPAVAASQEPVPPSILPRPTTGPAMPGGKESYDAGVAAYRAGNFKAARAAFLDAQAAGYTPPMQFDPPARYIAMIDRQEAAAARKTGPIAAAGTTQPALPPVPRLSPEEMALIQTAGVEAAREQYRQYEVKALLQNARKAQDENRLTDAYGFYKAARDLDPSNAEATQGVARLQDMIVGATQQTLLDVEVRRVNAIKEYDQHYFNQAILDARAALNAHEFNLIGPALDRAQAARDAHSQYWSREALAKFDAEIRGIREAARAEQERLANLDKIQRIEQEKAREEAVRQEAIKTRREKIAKLSADARRFLHDRNYIDALKVIDQLLAIDPANDWATGVRRLVQDNAIIQEQVRVRDMHDREFERQLDRAEEGKIPYMDIIKYPENWPEISEKRDREVAAERRQGRAEELGPRAALDTNLRDVNFRGQGFAQAIDFFRDVTGANIFVSWKALEGVGIKRETPVEISVRNVKFDAALKKILGEVGGPNVKLGYTVEDGMITITTAEELAKNTVTRFYDIRDLLVAPPEPDPVPTVSQAQRMRERQRERMMARTAPWNTSNNAPTIPYYKESPNSPGGAGASVEAVAPAGSAAHRSEQQAALIVSTIKRMVDRDSWIDNGGKVGEIRFIQGQLAVQQTPDNQRQVVSLLDRLRELHAIQVSIEARFLTIQRNYLEDIGLDLDFIFNITNPNRWSPIPVSQQSADFTATPATSAPGFGGAGVKPAITLQGSFLDDYQVNFLIRATQANKHSTIMTAPRVTVWNGQVATIVVGTEQAYVADLEAVTSGGSLYGAVAYNPIPDTILSGVTLTVRPTVSADRKYVTLSMTPTLSQLIDLVTFAVSAVNTTGTNPNPINPGGNPVQTLGVGNIQLPLTQITTLQTIVTVPDGGTLLLGGQTIAGEVEIEEGVPVLSKIPFLKRLFTNRSTAKDEQVLLILVRPSILIQREMENDAFPLLNTRARSAGQ